MPPPAARVKASDDDIFGDAGTDYVCELPKVGPFLTCSNSVPFALQMRSSMLDGAALFNAFFNMLAVHVTPVCHTFMPIPAS